MKHAVFDVVVIGGSLLDLFLFPHEDSEIFSPGDKVPIEYLHTDIGGGGINTAVGLARHHIKTALIAKVGNDEQGTYIKKRLESEGVDMHAVTFGNLNTGLSVIIEKRGADRTIFTYRGANAELTEQDISKTMLGNARFILINALYQHTSQLAGYMTEYATEQNIPIGMSLGIDEILFLGETLTQILPRLDMIILNEDEARTLYHVLLGTSHDKETTCSACGIPIEEVAACIQNDGPKQVGVTLGKDGVIFFDRQHKKYSVPAKQAEVINTTGLGDAFYAGFLAYYVKGYDITRCLVHGVDNATSVLGYIGAQIGLLKE